MSKLKFDLNKKNTALDRVLKLFGNLFFTLCTCIAFALILFSSVTIECVVVGSSMSPTLNADTKSGSDVVYVNKYMKDYSYGDIVVINITKSNPIIKRVIGLPGDVIDIVYIENEGYKLEINGKLIEENYIKVDNELGQMFQNGMDITYENFHEDLKKDYPSLFNEDNKLVVPDGEIFALGDNRHKSKDSTFYGTFKYENVVGTVELVRYSNDSVFKFYYDYVVSGKFFTTIKNCF